MYVMTPAAYEFEERVKLLWVDLSPLCRAAYDSPATARSYAPNRRSPIPRVALCTFLATVSSNDRRVLQRSPAVMRTSLWLESLVGHCVSYALMSIPPVGAFVLAIAGRTEAAVMVITFQVFVCAPCLSLAFLVLGKSLLSGIDESLERQQQRKQQLQSAGVAQENGKAHGTSLQDRSSGDPILLAARKKVKRVVMFAVSLPIQTSLILLFATVSRYGTETPLLFFFFPMTFTPPIWNLVNVTIHRGRTQLSREPLSSTDISSYLRRRSSLSVSSILRFRSQRQVVATEMSTGVP